MFWWSSVPRNQVEMILDEFLLGLVLQLRNNINECNRGNFYCYLIRNCLRKYRRILGKEILKQLK